MTLSRDWALRTYSEESSAAEDKTAWRKVTYSLILYHENRHRMTDQTMKINATISNRMLQR